MTTATVGQITRLQDSIARVIRGKDARGKEVRAKGDGSTQAASIIDYKFLHNS